MLDALAATDTPEDLTAPRCCRSGGISIVIGLPIASSGGIPEEPFRAAIPAADDAVQVLADDRVLGGFRRSPRANCCAALGLLAVADVDQHVDGADRARRSHRGTASDRQGTGRGVPSGRSATASAPLDRLPALQRNRHRAFVMRQGACRPANASARSRTTRFCRLRATAPQSDRGRRCRR